MFGDGSRSVRRTGSKETSRINENRKGKDFGRSVCKFCGNGIEWVRCEGKWTAVEGDRMGFHRCLSSLVPRFEEVEKD